MRSRLFALHGRALCVLLATSASSATSACGRLEFDANPALARVDATAIDTSPGNDTALSPCPFDICEGFEAPTINTALWTVDPQVQRDTTLARTGTASVHMHIDARATNQGIAARLLETRTFITDPPAIYVRAWIRMPSLPEPTNNMELISIEQGGAPDFGDYVFIQSNNVSVYSQFADAANGGNVAAPLDTWFCVNFEVVRSTGAGGSLTLTSDVVPSANVTGPTDGEPALGDLSIGILFPNTHVNVPQPALDLWVDDIIIHSAPITCDD